jgi:hypothetical protein
MHSPVFNLNKKMVANCRILILILIDIQILTAFEEEIRRFKSEENICYITGYFINPTLLFKMPHIYNINL